LSGIGLGSRGNRLILAAAGASGDIGAIGIGAGGLAVGAIAAI
jgi:hypothetical protein